MSLNCGFPVLNIRYINIGKRRDNVSMAKLFLHGVPDTPYVWRPLLAALHLDEGDYAAPHMPGFGVPLPPGFVASKEAYVDWLINQIEHLYALSGPVDVIGHDWGAILCVRAAQLRPDLIRSWAVSNAVPEPTYKWHCAARMWQTPLLGEFAMAMLGKARAEKVLIESAMPADMAKVEAAYIDKDMKRAILALYRSAKNMADEWGNNLSNLPEKGLVIWGETDPFVTIETARRFCDRTGMPLHIEKNAGHWAIAERARSIAMQLQDFWGE
jgi:pimeloyl-ACP methyl ester carboxylesterase